MSLYLLNTKNNKDTKNKKKIKEEIIKTKNKINIQLTFTFSKSTIKTPEKGMKYVQS